MAFPKTAECARRSNDNVVGEISESPVRILGEVPRLSDSASARVDDHMPLSRILQAVHLCISCRVYMPIAPACTWRLAFGEMANSSAVLQNLKYAAVLSVPIEGVLRVGIPDASAALPNTSARICVPCGLSRMGFTIC